MIYTPYVENKSGIELLKDHKIDEVIIGCKELSRASKISLEQMLELISFGKSHGLKILLEFDILVSEQDFNRTIKIFEKIPLDQLEAVRVQDVGLAYYLLENTDVDLHLITETGNHNLVGLKKWEEIFKSKLKRLVLSNELSWEKVKYYQENLSTPIEILGAGRILLFYTPRKLVSIYDRFEWVDDIIEVSATSEESPHKGFPVLENQHGTFMYHMKELFLLDRPDLLEKSGANFIRLDFRHQPEKLNTCLDLLASGAPVGELKEKVAPKSIRGYFLTNKSDVLFKKLKNYRIQRKDNDYIGEVIDSQKGGYLAIDLKNSSIGLGDTILIINPDGKEKELEIKTLRNTQGRDVSSKNSGLVLTEYVSGIWVKAQIYKKSAQDESHPAH